jgi:hypothetical protein
METCPDCHHLITQHIGLIDMGGGMVDSLGCIAASEDGDPACFCERYEFNDKETL